MIWDKHLHSMKKSIKVNQIRNKQPQTHTIHLSCAYFGIHFYYFLLFWKRKHRKRNAKHDSHNRQSVGTCLIFLNMSCTFNTTRATIITHTDTWHICYFTVFLSPDLEVLAVRVNFLFRRLVRSDFFILLSLRSANARQTELMLCLRCRSKNIH